MPNISDIKIAVENKNVFVRDEFIKHGDFLRNNNGDLIMYAGGFTAVFPVVVNNEKWAFRCWHTDLGNVKRRFQAIEQFVKSSKVSYLCDFAYVDEGLLVDGKLFPTTRMRWVDGMTIKEYVCANATNPSKLKELASRFLEMIEDMHIRGISHGDLQHGNILVNPEGHLFLVDYDSFFCPELKGECDIITGLAAYQHPARKDCRIANEKLDYFSELIIYMSILAVSESPDLVLEYQMESAEYMLFTSQDYLNIHQSSIYMRLSKLSSIILNLLAVLENYLSKNNITELEPFDMVLDRMNVRLMLSKNKIKIHKEHAFLSWKAENAKKIELYENGKIVNANVAKKGEIKVNPNETTHYELQVEMKNGKTIRKETTLYVFPESVVSFISDKNYVFPSIPFTLTWEVKDASKVELDGSEVDHSGTKLFSDGIENETQYVLRVTDHFDTKDYHIIIKMLPVPIMHIHTSPPAISTTINVATNLEVPNIELSMPSIPLKSVEFSVGQPREIHCVELRDDISSFRTWFQFDSIVAKIKSIKNKKSKI